MPHGERENLGKKQQHHDFGLHSQKRLQMCMSYPTVKPIPVVQPNSMLM